MNKTATALLSVGLLATSMMFVPVQAAATPATDVPLRFGMESGSITDQTNHGVKPDYGTFWIGPWTLKSGWAGPDGQLDSMKAQGVTPAVHFYYWGDDISQNCIENGCWSSLHSAQKNKADWQKLAQQMTDHLNARMGGKPVVIFLETEFNKADVQTYEPLDGYLAEKAAFIKKEYPNAEVVLSLGTWNTPAWKTWDRAAAASDLIGIQAMRGSTRDSYTHYRDLFESTVAGAKTAQAMFGKPVFVIDVALSSHPEPEYLGHQAAELKEFFTGMTELKAAGVEAMIYRSWRDSNMDLANYYGEAERHWGLSWSGSPVKAAGQVWIDGVKAERASAAPGGPAPEPEPPVKVPLSGASVEAESFAYKQNGAAQADAQASGSKAWNLWTNGEVRQGLDLAAGEYELTVRARGTQLGGVGPNMDVYLGGQKVLSTEAGTAYGDHTVRVQAGGAQELRIVFTNDAKSASEDRNLVLDRVSLKGIPPGPFTAGFQPSQNVNEWWVEVRVTGPTEPAKVEARKDGGAWVALQKTAWGTHAKSFQAPAGGQMTFRATDAYGQTVTSEAYPWLAKAPEPEPVNAAPVAVAALAADGLTVLADGRGSTDPDGDALTHAWDFGDGAKATGDQASHAYAAPGAYTVTLTVSDGGLSHSVSQTVTAVRPNRAPVAVPVLVTDGLTVHADAAGSTDPDGDAFTHAWDFGDGAKATGGKASHAYAAPGAYTVTLTVTDGSLSHSASKTVAVVQVNRAPVAVVQATTDGLTVRADGTGSTDPDGDRLVYAWDFGDGGKGSGPTASHAYKQAGTYTVRLAVGDGKLSDVKAQTVVVKAPFQAAFATSPNVNEWWVEVRVDGSGVDRVEASVDGGAWTELPRTAWGTHAKSMPVPAGSKVVFRATGADGQSATSETVDWLGGVLKVSFEPRAVGNPWWLEAVVTPSKELAKVELRVDGGAWRTMDRTAWGTYSLKMDAQLPTGAKVQFRATDTYGLSVASQTHTWT